MDCGTDQTGNRFCTVKYGCISTDRIEDRQSTAYNLLRIDDELYNTHLSLRLNSAGDALPGNGGRNKQQLLALAVPCFNLRWATLL